MIPARIPDEVRMEPGMLLVRREKATDRRPERRKVIVLVRPTTRRRPVSVFDPDSPMKDVTAWVCVRMRSTTDTEETHLTGPGTFSLMNESAVRKMYHFIGYLGDRIDSWSWEDDLG